MDGPQALLSGHNIHPTTNDLYFQDVFTKKVLAQKDDIDLIAATAVGATENIRDGNEELRKAIQNQVE